MLDQLLCRASARAACSVVVPVLCTPTCNRSSPAGIGATVDDMGHKSMDGCADVDEQRRVMPHRTRYNRAFPSGAVHTNS